MLPLHREVAWPCSSTALRRVAHGLAIATAVAVGTAYVAGPRVIRCWATDSKHDIARATVMKYAYETFPSWAVEHPDRACPRSLAELGESTDPRLLVDPWGTRYHFACGEHAIPRTAHGVWIVSAGEDGVFGTADDVRSDR